MTLADSCRNARDWARQSILSPTAPGKAFSKAVIPMPVVKIKYRPTSRYFHVLAALVRAAHYRGVTTYQDVAVIMGLPLSGSHMAKEVGRVLGEISEDEVAAGRPMLSSVAVSVDGKPGPGFYDLACKLGRLLPTQDELAFWRKECEASYAAWKRPLPKVK